MPNRFDDWEEIDCNQCEHYWNNSCDSLPKGSRKPCNSFLATRKVIIPEKIKSLESRLNWLTGEVFIVIILIAIYIIVHSINP